MQQIQDLAQNMKTSIINTLIPIIANKQQESALSKPNITQTRPTAGNKSYAAALSGKQTHQTASIYIAPDPNSSESPALKETAVCQFLSKNHTEARVHRVKVSEKGGILLKMNSDADVTTIAKTLTDNLGVQAKPKPLALPKITISRIPASESLDPNALKTELFASNPWLSKHADKVFDIIFTYKPKDFVSAVIRVSPEIRQEIFLKNNSLNVGVRVCPVRDRFHIPLCTKCSKFGHKASGCTKDVPTCCFCASDNHSFSTCPHKTTASKHKCANCLSAKHKTNIAESAHNAFSKTCPTFLEHVNNKIKQTNWGEGPRPSI